MIWLCLALGVKNLEAQQWQLALQVPAPFQSATIDAFDNVYLVSTTGQVKKISIKGDSLAIYNQVRNFGQLQSIDVTNPLRPVLFYKSYGRLVLLDRFLALRHVIDLRKAGILQPAAVAVSYDNNIWVFDEYDSRLKKIDEQGKLLMQTPDLRVALGGKALAPLRIVDQEGNVYVADASQGVLVFDQLGALRNRLPQIQGTSFFVEGSKVYFISQGKMLRYDMKTFREPEEYFLPGAMKEKALLLFPGNKMLELSTDSLKIWLPR